MTILRTLLGLAVATPALAADPALQLELNRLEPVEAGCRAYLVLKNAGEALDSLELDLVGFGTDGVIRERLAVELGPLPAAKTSVRLFDLGGGDCAGLGSLLVNDVLACRGAAGELPDCVGRIAVASRAAAALTK